MIEIIYIRGINFDKESARGWGGKGQVMKTREGGGVKLSIIQLTQHIFCCCIKVL